MYTPTHHTIGYLGLLIIFIAAAATIWYLMRKHFWRGQLLHSPKTMINTGTKSYQEDSYTEITRTTPPIQMPPTGITATQTSQRVSYTVPPDTGCVCRDPISTQNTTSMTSIQDALEQLRELYHEAKKRTKKKEGEASYYQTTEEYGQLDPGHFL